jgi:Rod binding domain-containing protein
VSDSVSLRSPSGASPSLAALPAVSDAALPRDVRGGSDADKKAYKAALGFEKVLLGQLVKEMTAATPSLTEGARGDAVTEAMTDALANAGGIGLAPQLYKTLQRTAP